MWNNYCSDCSTTNSMCTIRLQDLLNNPSFSDDSNGEMKCRGCLHPVNHHCNNRKCFF